MSDDLNDWNDSLDDVRIEHAIVVVRQSQELVEWRCPTCGRHVQVAHAGRLSILDPGDPTVLHRGSTGIHWTGSLATFPDTTPRDTIH